MYVKIGPVGRKNRAEKVVIDDYDVWNLDHSLALIIVPALKKLKEKKQGAPFVDNEDVSEELRASDEDLHTYSKNGETDDRYFDRWDYIMDEMIWAFQQKLEDDWDEQFFSGGHALNGKFNKEGYEKYSDRINNGFKLFGKYYNGLWD